jgi:hypothetical protein
MIRPLYITNIVIYMYITNIVVYVYITHIIIYVHIILYVCMIYVPYRTHDTNTCISMNKYHIIIL